jgi:hypothetical protein
MNPISSVMTFLTDRFGPLGPLLGGWPSGLSADPDRPADLSEKAAATGFAS